jgi:hypothetical protein
MLPFGVQEIVAHQSPRMMRMNGERGLGLLVMETIKKPSVKIEPFVVRCKYIAPGFLTLPVVFLMKTCYLLASSDTSPSIRSHPYDDGHTTSINGNESRSPARSFPVSVFIDASSRWE